MSKLLLNKDIISQMNYLYANLYNNSSEKAIKTPKIAPNGTKLTKLKQIADIMQVDMKIAAYYVLEDETSDDFLKAQAKSEISLGYYVAADDSFIPVINKAYNLINNEEKVEIKDIRLVRTSNGVRRYRQKQGTIIVRDGKSSLDKLTALPNDIRGYDKVADPRGNVYYIGNENGNWVVRSPTSPDAMHQAADQEGAFTWLNQKVGGAPTVAKKKKETVARATGAGSRSSIDPNADLDITIDQAKQLLKLNPDQLDLYRKLIERGLNHDQAILLAIKTPVAKG